MILDIEIFMRDAFKNLKVQVQVEEKLEKERKLRRTMIKEEETFRQMQINDVADMKAQVRYDCTMGEGVEQATFSSCGETTAKDEADE